MASNPETPAVPRIDFYSDTITRPTRAMRQAMAEAEVGNEQAGEDPTVNRLCHMTAELLGKEAAVFLPSGTMCNQIAYRVWCAPGQEILLEKSSHALHFEVGGLAANAGAMTRTIEGKRGLFTGAQVTEGIRAPHGYHTQRTALVSVENTANMGGGTVWPIEQLRGVSAAAREQGIPVHMDGARLPNAVVASGTSAKEYAAEVDSVWIDLSKGLGCPVGAVLAGTEDFIAKVWAYKHMYGGAMRQAGIIAAAGVYALEHHVERLAEDHVNARRLARGLAEIEGISVNANEIDTNMVFFDVAGLGVTAADFSRRMLAEHDIRVGPMGPSVVRAVTHLDVDAAGIEDAITAAKSVAASL
jgi:threonine aldolase